MGLFYDKKQLGQRRHSHGVGRGNQTQPREGLSTLANTTRFSDGKGSHRKRAQTTERPDAGCSSDSPNPDRLAPGCTGGTRAPCQPSGDRGSPCPVPSPNPAGGAAPAGPPSAPTVPGGPGPALPAAHGTAGLSPERGRVADGAQAPRLTRPRAGGLRGPFVSSAKPLPSSPSPQARAAAAGAAPHSPGPGAPGPPCRVRPPSTPRPRIRPLRAPSAAPNPEGPGAARPPLTCWPLALCHLPGARPPLPPPLTSHLRTRRSRRRPSLSRARRPVLSLPALSADGVALPSHRRGPRRHVCTGHGLLCPDRAAGRPCLCGALRRREEWVCVEGRGGAPWRAGGLSSPNPGTRS